MIGQILGDRYEILEKIGEGGMAVVYKARCNKLNRFVAVKILKKEFSDNEEIVGKFTREATAIAALSDPNIVNILDVGKQDDLNYIVMEYVDGKTLKDIIREYGRLNFDSTIDVAIQIAKALDCAHKNKIIHRDVKPQNIMVMQDGRIKVTDFGIAKSASSATITNTTTIMGSAHYFSPEQAKGSMVDARTDLYSLGVVLYEMATGKLPFEAESPVSIALKHIQEDVVPPKQINSKIPDSLNNLIIKAMQKDPNRRYQSAKEILKDLEKIKDDPNAVIGAGTVDDDNEHTIVMSPVKDDIAATNYYENNDNQDQYDSENEEDDEYDDDEYYDDEYYDDKEKPKKKGKKIALIALAVVLVLGIVGVVCANLLSGGSIIGDGSKKDVVVPNISGMTIDEATKALKEVGLELVDRGSEKSSEPEGTIIGVDPKEGTTVKEGSKVNVITSEGSEKVKMLNFSGAELSDVKDFLDNNDIKYEITNAPSDEIESGLVIKTDPGEGKELDSSITVKIYVSSGPETKLYTVPDVKGLTLDVAQEKLSNFDVNIVEKDVTSDSQVGVVLSQTNAGKKLEAGSTVTITVGKKKEEAEKSISSLISTGMYASSAKTILEANGYTVYIEGDADGKVKSWSPSSAKKGDTITIVAEKEKTDTSGSGKGNSTNENNNNNNNNNNLGSNNDQSENSSSNNKKNN